MDTVPPSPPPPIPPAPVHIESTEIPLSSLPPEHSSLPKVPFWKKKKFIISIGGLLFFIVSIIILSLLFQKPAPVKKAAPKPTPSPTPVVSTILLIDTKKHPQILINTVPHFSDLKLSDLPNIYDIRGVFNYKKNLIIVSTSGIIEYNPKTNEIVRQNDPRAFSCIDYATVIQKNLYVSCNGVTQPQGIYVINLDTGKLEKIYREGSAKLVFSSVAHVGDTLWVGAMNEIVKINTQNDTMQEYSPKDLGITDCQRFMIHAYTTQVWATCVSPTTAGVFTYNSSQKTWTAYIPPNSGSAPIYTLGYNPNTLYFLSYNADPILYTYHSDTKTWESTHSATLQIPSSKPLAEEMRTQLQKDVIFPGLEQKSIAYLSYFDTVEKKVKDLELVISPYIGLSDIVDEKRYVFTHTAIDKVTAKTFPKAFKKMNLPVGLGTKTFVDPFENYAVLIGSASASTPPFTAYLVEVKKGIVTDLLKDNESIQDAEPENLLHFSNNLDTDYRIAGTSKNAQVLDKVTGDNVIDIDFATKTLTFSD